MSRIISPIRSSDRLPIRAATEPKENDRPSYSAWETPPGHVLGQMRAWGESFHWPWPWPWPCTKTNRDYSEVLVSDRLALDDRGSASLILVLISSISRPARRCDSQLCVRPLWVMYPRLRRTPCRDVTHLTASPPGCTMTRAMCALPSSLLRLQRCLPGPDDALYRCNTVLGVSINRDPDCQSVVKADRSRRTCVCTGIPMP
jgi:hypothetical protein